MEVIQRVVVWWLGSLLDRGKADAILREGRASHVAWANYAVENPDALELETAGDRVHHVRWIGYYDHVLKVVRRWI